jgi:hypothetical protein
VLDAQGDGLGIIDSQTNGLDWYWARDKRFFSDRHYTAPAGVLVELARGSMDRHGTTVMVPDFTEGNRATSGRRTDAVS